MLTQTKPNLPQNTFKMTNDLERAIKINTAEDADREILSFVGGVVKAMKTYNDNKPLCITPNWKLKTEKEAQLFFNVAVAFLERATNKKFHVCRTYYEHGHDGHLMLVLGYGMPEKQFYDVMNDAFKK